MTPHYDWTPASEPNAPCEHGCNGCDECTDYGDEPDEYREPPTEGKG